MKKIKLIIALSVVLLLSGCGETINPETVLNNMYESISKIKQTEVLGRVDLSGEPNQSFDGLSEIELLVNGKIKLDFFKDFEYSMNLVVNGKSDEGATRIGAEIKSFSDYNYFRVTDISLPLGLPFSLVADDQWYKVKKNSNTSSNVLGSARTITDEESDEIRELISQSQLFLFQQLLPDQTINGNRSYHLKVKINKEAWEKLLNKINQVSDSESMIEVQSIVELLSSYNYDIWVSRQDYNLTKILVNGIYSNKSDGEIDFIVEFNFTQFNNPVSIVRPNEVEDFRLDSLFGLPVGSF